MANVYKNAKINLSANTATTFYTVPSGRTTIIKSMIASEKTNQSTTLSVILFNGDPASGGVAFNIYTTKALGGNSTTELLEKPLIMNQNEVLQLTAGHANRCVVTASLLEIFDEKSA